MNMTLPDKAMFASLQMLAAHSLSLLSPAASPACPSLCRTASGSSCQNKTPSRKPGAGRAVQLSAGFTVLQHLKQLIRLSMC